MEHPQPSREALLEAWMGMTAVIRGNRLLDGLSMNEMLICNVLYQQRRQGGPPVTATDLCRHTRLLKSQINHILTSMEKRRLIRRVRSQEDRRVIHIQLQSEALPLYRREHETVMEILETICGAMGEDGARQLTALLNQATAAAAHYQIQRSDSHVHPDHH